MGGDAQFPSAYGPDGTDDDPFGTIAPVRVSNNPNVPHDSIGRVIWFDEDGGEHRIETAKWIRARERELQIRRFRQYTADEREYLSWTMLFEGQERYQESRRDGRRKKGRQARRKADSERARRTQVEEQVARGHLPADSLLGGVPEGQLRLAKFMYTSQTPLEKKNLCGERHLSLIRYRAFCL